MAVRIKIGLKCQENGDINYTTWKNPKLTLKSLRFKKNIVEIKKHTLHKEVKLKS